MSITAAKLYKTPGTDTEHFAHVQGLRSRFAESALNASRMNQEQIQTTVSSAVNDDALVLNPYDKTTMQRILSRVENGQWGKAVDMLNTHLDGKTAYETREILQDFADKCLDRGVSQPVVFDMLSFMDLGMDVEFFNTGPNSSGDVSEPSVEENRYHIQAHFKNELHKPIQDVQPFLGASYG